MLSHNVAGDAAMLDVTMDLISRSPSDPRTLIRAVTKAGVTAEAIKAKIKEMRSESHGKWLRDALVAQRNLGYP